MAFTLQDFIIECDASLLEAFKKLDYNTRGFLIAVNNGKLEGTLTDGDIRRGLLGGKDLSNPVSSCMRLECTFFDVTTSFSTIIDAFKNKKIGFLPLVDGKKVVRNVVTKAQMQTLLLYDTMPEASDDFLNIDESMIEHEIHPRPWGFYKTTVLNHYFQSKIMSVNPKATLSLQLHHRREEYWTIVHGEGVAQVGESFIPLHGGSSVFIPKGCKHRLTNLSDTESLIITEVQIGDYFGEDDIIRFEDEYGRV